MIKTNRRLKYAFAAPLFIFSIVIAQFANVPFASAATKTWDGGGSNNNWSTAANWNGDTVPVDGDVVTFNASDADGYETVLNNISGLSLGGILYTGATDDGGYSIAGSSTLALTGNVTSTATYNGTPDVLSIDLPITLGANVVAQNVSFDGVGRTINTNGYSLTSGSSSAGCVVVAALTGSGTFQTGSGNPRITLKDGATEYTGNIVISSGTVTAEGPSSFGTSAGTTTVQNSGSLSIYLQSSSSTWTEPFVLGGSGKIGVQHGSTDGCSGSAPVDTRLATFTGPVTLTSDFVFNGSDNLTISGTYNANGHSFTTASGAAGILTTPEGTSEAPSEETTYSDDQPNTSLNISANQTAILTGTRAYINVGQSGTLKGTGTALVVDVIGGTIAPGLSPGTLTILEELYMSEGSTYQAELKTSAAGEYDQLRVSDPSRTSGQDIFLDAGSVLEVSLYEGYSIKQGDQFTIIDNLQEPNFTVNGTFEGLAEGAQFEVNGITFSITYEGGDGNDVVITALTDGEDPNAPNTGVAQILLANPVILAGLAMVTFGLLIAVAFRRRNTQ